MGKQQLSGANSSVLKQNIRKLLHRQSTGVVVFLMVIVVFFSIFANHFMTMQNMKNILFSASVLAVAAVGESLVLLTGNYDLSVGSILGIVAFITYDICSHIPGAGTVVIIVGIVFGLLLGAVNGFLVGYLKIPSMVATLGTLSVYRGLDSWYAGSREVTKNQIPHWVSVVSPSSILGIPTYVWLCAVLCIVVTLILTKRPAGRMLYAFGSNPLAADSFGLNSRKIIFTAYACSGMFAGFAGMLLGAQVGTINSVMGNGYEMEVIAAAVIGGVSLWGGVGTPFGAMVGALVYACLDNGLILLGVNEYSRLIFQGVAVIVAVGVDAFIRLQSKKASSRHAILEAAA